jgi:metallophosphoesterase (TIGR00282 family)
MRVLFVGDVIGKPGRRALAALLPELIDQRRVDYTIVNVENAAGGFGVTAEILSAFDELPIDVYTSGNHIWDKREGVDLLDREPRLLRPANYPDGNPGRGVHVGETASGVPVATINLEGQVFMKALGSPFLVADRLLAELPKRVKVVVVDFHAEATSEKQAIAFHLDGRVSAVLGTHTHVPTADARLLPQGTAYISDIGMTGPRDSIIGFSLETVLPRFTRHLPTRFAVADGPVAFNAVVISADRTTGRASAIEQVQRLVEV